MERKMIQLWVDGRGRRTALKESGAAIQEKWESKSVRGAIGAKARTTRGGNASTSHTVCTKLFFGGPRSRGRITQYYHPPGIIFCRFRVTAAWPIAQILRPLS
jgi:hypothetical protein